MAKRLAVVDDQQTLREVLGIFLEANFPDLEVVAFSGGEEILRVLGKGDRFDVVIMDGNLSDGDTGPRYTAEIVAKHPETAVIAFSFSLRLKPKFIENGACAFLLKSSSLGKIKQVVRTALGLNNL